MRKTGNITYIAICLIFCVIPFAGMLFYRTDTTTENKTLAALPQPEKDGKLNVDFFDECSEYFEDHFAFRQEFVTADAEILSKVFGVSNVDTVMAGTDGWLYYTDTLDDYLGQNVMTKRQAFNTVHNLLLLQNFVTEQGADFVFTVAPNKNSLYGENMPYYAKYKAGDVKNIDLIVPGLYDMGVSYVDLFKGFKDSKEKLYLKRDSHWNNKGAVLVYDTILDYLEMEHETYDTVKAVREEREYGDLNKMMYPLSARPEWNYYYRYDNTWEYTSDENNVEAAWIKTYSPSGKGSLLMFRDSFGNTLLPLMAEHFGEASFSKGVPYHIAEYMKQCDPELVIAEKVERNLDEFMTMPPVMPGPEVSLENVAASGKMTASVEMKESMDDVNYWIFSGVVGDSGIDPDSLIYVQLTAGDSTKVYEAFTTTTEESDYGYQLYLPKEELQAEGIAERDSVVVGIIAEKQDILQIIGTKEITVNMQDAVTEENAG